MNGNHNIYLQWKDTITSTYNGWLPQHLVTMDGYHINLTYNEWLPQHLLKMNGYHSVSGYYGNLSLKVDVMIAVHCK
jgi:hypothetical protein